MLEENGFGAVNFTDGGGRGQQVPHLTAVWFR
jgi:hypothetical protein